MMWRPALVLLLAALAGVAMCDGDGLGEVTSLNDESFDHYIQSHEVVMVDFFADWCRFCQMLKPVYEQAARDLQGQPRIRLVKVDCEDPGSARKKEEHGITKFPTLKIFRNGKVLKQEYRGQRSAQAMSAFLISLLTDAVTLVSNENDMNAAMSKSKRAVVGRFVSNEAAPYQSYHSVASSLRDDCTFIAQVGGAQAGVTDTGLVFFRHHGEDTQFKGSVDNSEALLEWAKEQCNPLVREITFENGEELTEEGLPFLILFYNPDDTKSIKEFRDVAHSRFAHERGRINFITADGVRFAHPLRHLGKEKKDLPVLAFDTFKHMYLFKKFANIKKPGKLEQFVADLHSGKLHHDFHNPPAVQEEDDTPDEPAGELAAGVNDNAVEIIPDDRKETIAEKINNAVEEKVEMVEAAQQVKKIEAEDKKKTEALAQERGVPVHDVEHHEEETAKPIAVKSVMGKLKPSQNRYSFREEL